MERHPYFDLLLHTDSELATLTGSAVVERVTLHEWPLSCVQRVSLADGKRLIYKSECGPTVEPEFYRQVCSPLLVTAQVIYRTERYACLLIEEVTSPLASDLSPSEPDALEMGRAILRQIADIPHTAPVYLDVGNWERWQAIMAGMVEDLHGLVSTGKYRQVSGEAISAIARSATSKAVRSAFDDPVGIVQHDLSAENVFVLPAGFKVIDWQRPILGPAETDLALFMTSLDYDPRPYVAGGIIEISDLLLIHWLVECSLAWFPPGTETYDRTIAQLAQKIVKEGGS